MKKNYRNKAIQNSPQTKTRESETYFLEFADGTCHEVILDFSTEDEEEEEEGECHSG